MSQLSLVYCRPIHELDRYWEFVGPDGQLFYDYSINLFTFRKGNDFFPVKVKDNQLIAEPQFQILNSENIIALTYSPTRKYVALQTGISTIKMVNLETRKEHKINLKSWDKTGTIILFEWLRKTRSEIDFFIADTNAIRLYKLDEEKSQLKELTYFSHDTYYAWFEPRSEVLLVANTSGVMQTVWIENFTKTKKIKGPLFMLDLRADMDMQAHPKLILNLSEASGVASSAKSSMSASQMNKAMKNTFFAQASQRNQNLLYTNMNDQNPYNHHHKILTVSMYDVPTLIHINSNLGKIFIYSITPEKVLGYQPSFTVTCTYAMNLVDNVLVVNNVSERISFLYDIKKANPVQPIGIPQALPITDIIKPVGDKGVAPQNLGVSSVKKSDEGVIDGAEEENKDSDNTTVASQVQEDSLASTESAANTEDLNSRPLNGHNQANGADHTNYLPVPIESNPIYLTTTRFLDYSFIIDVKNRKAFKFEVDTSVIERIFEHDIDTLHFLTRRRGCKETALYYLRDMILKKEPLVNLSAVFNRLALTHRKAYDDYKEANKDINMLQSQAMTSPPRYLQNSALMPNAALARQDPTKPLLPSNIIVQADLQTFVFESVIEDKSCDHEYFIEVLFEYIRISIENGILVMDETQAIFFKLILINKKFTLLQFMLQFHCIHETLDLAEVLIKLGFEDKSKYKGSKEANLGKYVTDEYVPEMLQVGFDMLLRMDKIKELIEHLLSLGKIYDAIELAKKRAFQGVNLRLFLEAASKEGAQCSLNDITNFLLNNVRRGKTEEKCLFEQDVVDVIRNFQNDLSPS